MDSIRSLLRQAALIAAGLCCLAPPARPQDAPRPAVVVAPAEVADLRFGVSYTGRVRAAQKVELRARVSGFLEAVHFTEGETVAAGDLLFSIQDDAYAAAVREAEGSVRAAEAERDLARLERDRKATLVQRQAVAQSELDVAEAQLARIEGQLQQLNAALDRQKLELSYTEITAPFAGTLGLTSFDVGALVGPDSGPLVTLTRLDSVEVETQVETARVLDFRAAQAAGKVGAAPTVRITLPNGAAYPLEGSLDYISADVGQGTDTVTVRARFDNPEGTLLDGALVRVALEQADPEMVLSVPQSAVQRDQLGTFVMVVGPDGKVEQRRVAVARSSQGRSVIEEGLAEGEQVIVEGLNKVRPGVLVDAAPAG
jgi:membrane fusion protein (multidrug efflux system)